VGTEFEYDENAAVLAWFQLVNSPEYKECVQFEATTRLSKAISDGLDRNLSGSDRDAASGRAEAWTVVMNWGPYYTKMYEDLKREQSDVRVGDAEAPPRWPEESKADVPAEADRRWPYSEPVL
jgi:hypothetical protein